MVLRMIETLELYITLVSFSIITFCIAILPVNIILGFILVLPVEIASQFDFIRIYSSRSLLNLNT